MYSVLYKHGYHVQRKPMGMGWQIQLNLNSSTPHITIDFLHHLQNHDNCCLEKPFVYCGMHNKAKGI